MEMKKQLAGLYEDYKKKWEKAATETSPDFLERLSSPLLLSARDAWPNSKKRLLMVGQETLGWGFQEGEYYPWDGSPIISFLDFLNVSNAVQLLQNGYEHFDFSKHQPENYRSPFWQTYRTLREKLENDMEWSILWSNLFRFSVDGGSVIGSCTEDELSTVSNLNRGILNDEIATLKPSCVIFFTGPNYDFELERCFQGIEYSQFKAHPVREVALLKHPALPTKSYRTYHPRYLFMRKWDIFEDILHEI